MKTKEGTPLGNYHSPYEVVVTVSDLVVEPFIVIYYIDLSIKKSIVVVVLLKH